MLRIDLFLLLLSTVFLPDALNDGGALAWLAIGVLALLVGTAVRHDIRRHEGTESP
ncbi:hypothetical protein [Pseudonocardia sp. HH130629-09]|uniref:hypothetical protein n=1 Tax=Pseudonocardia sp. HH130629-09 TaxID=1641402 RepID=UPI000B1DEF3F|nr:hypothetical protein [Pseudonocardia sp. HH130629-09]